MAATSGKENPLATRLSNYGGVLIALVMIAQASEYLRGYPLESDLLLHRLEATPLVILKSPRNG